MSVLPITQITPLESAGWDSGALQPAYGALLARWQDVHDRETALRLLFLAWYHTAEPDFLTRAQRSRSAGRRLECLPGAPPGTAGRPRVLARQPLDDLVVPVGVRWTGARLEEDRPLVSRACATSRDHDVATGEIIGTRRIWQVLRRDGSAHRNGAVKHGTSSRVWRRRESNPRKISIARPARLLGFAVGPSSVDRVEPFASVLELLIRWNREACDRSGSRQERVHVGD